MRVIDHRNNFDIIRLCAAFQVAFLHISYHLKIHNVYVDFIVKILSPFPGMIVFFTISGFLITHSAERSGSLISYFRKRILRIYPALIVAFAILLALLYVFKELDSQFISSPLFYLWVLAQLSFGQFFTPEALRSWGSGTPNGSLWSIPIELQFYLLLPLVLAARKSRTLITVTLAIISLTVSIYVKNNDEKTLIFKLLDTSIFVYFWAFALGILINFYWEKIKVIFHNTAIYLFIIYILFGLMTGYWATYHPTVVGVLSNILLAILTLSFAYSFVPNVNLLRGVDVSYGLYIYHMIVVNVFIAFNWTGDAMYVVYTLVVSLLLAYLSWTFVESRILKLTPVFTKIPYNTRYIRVKHSFAIMVAKIWKMMI